MKNLLVAIFCMTRKRSRAKKLFAAMAVFSCTTVLAQVNVISDTSSRIGLGTLNPQTRLHVAGDTRLAGNLTADSIVVMKDSLKVMGSSALKDVTIDGNAIITGDAKISGTLNLSSDISFGNNFGMKIFPGPSGSSSVFSVGPVTSFTANPVPPLSCLAPTSGAITQFNSAVDLVGVNPAFATQSHLTLGFDGTDEFIEAGSNSLLAPAQPVLNINNQCGRDIRMCTGALGGVVSTGKYFEIGSPVRNINVAANIKAANQTGIQINNTFTGNFSYAQKNVVDRDLTKAFAVLNNSSGTEIETFNVNGDGSTAIQVPITSLSPISFSVSNITPLGLSPVLAVSRDGRTTIHLPAIQFNTNQTAFEIVDVPNAAVPLHVRKDGYVKIELSGIYDNTANANAFDITDKISGKVNFRIKRTGTLYMREGYAQAMPFPDYVFKSGYKIKTLTEVKQYIAQNGHLHGVMSAEEVAKEGIPLGEMARENMEKTEELFLHAINHDEKIQEIEKENENLKKENNELKAKMDLLEKRMNAIEGKIR